MPDILGMFGKWAAIETRVQNIEKNISSLREDYNKLNVAVSERLAALEASFEAEQKLYDQAIKAQREYLDQKIETASVRTQSAAAHAASAATNLFVNDLIHMKLRLEHLEGRGRPSGDGPMPLLPRA